MDKKLSEVEIQKLKKKSDEANTLNRALTVNSHGRVVVWVCTFLKKYFVKFSDFNIS